MRHNIVNIMGMVLDEWTHKSCVAHIATGDSWATIYDIRSKEPGKGHASELIKEAKKFYEAKGLDFGTSIVLSSAMKHLCRKLKVKEYV